MKSTGILKFFEKGQTYRNSGSSRKFEELKLVSRTRSFTGLVLKRSGSLADLGKIGNPGISLSEPTP
jgi:hypothetical protein